MLRATQSLGIGTGAIVSLITILAVLAPAASSAADITATARIFCPAQMAPGTDHIDTTFMLPVTPAPCAGIRVVAMDADPLKDEMCGAAFTGADGRVTIRGRCGDGIDPAPELYLKVEGRSENGFSVGVVHPDWAENILEEIGRALAASAGVPPSVVTATEVFDRLDDLRDHRTFEWISEVVPGGAFGSRVIGGGAPVSMMAARHFSTAQFTMNRLRGSTRFLPMDFNYSLNAPIGFPTTLYDTVIVDFPSSAGADPAPTLQAVPHEIGHVLYNTYHSDLEHWLEDGPDYMTQHNRCDTNHFQTLAWYEGFADFVRAFVFQRWDWNAWTWALGSGPRPGCAFNTDAGGAFVGPRSMSVEGNVEGLLNNVFFGPVRPALDAAIRASVSPTFTCPSGQTLIEPDSSSPTGTVPQCESDTPISCAPPGRHVEDYRGGLTDKCQITVTPECPDRAPNCQPEPVDQLETAWCRAGRTVRGVGRDRCLVRAPAMAVAAGPLIVPNFACEPGETLVPPPPSPFGGATRCAVAVPIGCSAGTLFEDFRDETDFCRGVVDPDCPPDAHGCEPTHEVEVPASCPAVPVTRRPGRDTCTRLVAARHDLPNGNPRQRPDGSPDAVLGLDEDGNAAWLGLPSLDEVMTWVDAAGTRGHRAGEFWSDWIRPWCQGRDGLRYRYCHPNRSLSFRLELDRLDPALNALN